MSICTGVLLWIEPVFGAVWGIVTVVPLVIDAGKYTVFVVDTIKEARKLRKGDDLLPAKGTRAPPSSICDDVVGHAGAEEYTLTAQRSESPAPVDPRDIANANHFIQALPPPTRHQTMGLETHASSDSRQQPARQETDPGIVDDLYDAQFSECPVPYMDKNCRGPSAALYTSKILELCRLGCFYAWTSNSCASDTISILLFIPRLQFSRSDVPGRIRQ